MIIIVGPSLAGKSTLQKKLCNDFGYKRFVTVTTRRPRAGEIDGVDYYFYSKERFEEELSCELLMEAAPHGDNMYGMQNMPEEELIEGNYVAVLNKDGVKFMESRIGRENLTTVFLHKPNKETAREVPTDINARKKHEMKDDEHSFDFTFYDYCSPEDVRAIARYDLS